MKKRLEDATLLALKKEDGAVSQGMQHPLEARKGKKMDSPRARRRRSALISAQ